MAARSRQLRRVRPRHGSDPGQVPGQPSDYRRRRSASIRRTCSRPSVSCRATTRRPNRYSATDVVAALKQAAERGVRLQNIRSVAGFERRLNDITCSGCHQTRGIGGFHFPGVDSMAAEPSNSTIVPASPHFFGDQVRRRDILTRFGTANRRIIRADFQNGRNCAAAGNWPEPNTMTAGARIVRAYVRRPIMTAASGHGPAHKGSRYNRSAAPSRMGMCFVSDRH